MSPKASERLEGGDSLDEFLEGFPGVTRDQAVAAIQLAASGRLQQIPRVTESNRLVDLGLLVRCKTVEHSAG